MLLLLLLGLWMLPALVRPKQHEIIATLPEERPDEIVQQVLDRDVALLPTLLSGRALAAIAPGLRAELPELERPQLDTTALDRRGELQVAIGQANVFASSGEALLREAPKGTLGDALVVVDGYDAAMDRITREILNMLARNKVLVVWCFDQSESMRDDLAAIMARIERVYRELDLYGAARGDALLTAVTSYGKDFAVQTRAPTYNVEEILAAMRSVPVDPSGLEMQCQAVSLSIANHRRYTSGGARRMMLILVTDESGDPQSNVQYLEATIAEAKAAACPIYVLGREAVFGYPFAYMRWVAPQTGRMYWLEIDRGPETPLPEQLQFDGLRRRNDAHPSGFGPYEQARMARQTGGLFFMLPSPEIALLNRDDRRYQLERMRPYLPDLSARHEYVIERDKYENRATLWKIISDLNPYAANGRQLTIHDALWPAGAAQFSRLAQAEMAKAAKIIGYLHEAQLALERLQPLRQRESSPRWRANYDLIYAQTIGYQARLMEYGALLQGLTRQPLVLQNPGGPGRPTIGLRLYERREMVAAGQTQAMRDRAAELLRFVVAEHPGTPYATRAEWELARSYGFGMREIPQPLNNNRGNRPQVTPPRL